MSLPHIIEQDNADTEFARDQVRYYRVSRQRVQPERVPLVTRIAMALGLVGGACLIGGVTYLIATFILVFGG
ncbi:hypothetical protein UFOVP152_42 [uncultured Caudovirales phage]|uniref:Uncharacterized protein n=1 Tax=uncultured Caudovirales phage TaxID=2100421 RepID=A0A6J7W9H6_9CAUD|nr:hypothetical protein UFOVP152_42 [uncultured Caudovirales phage]